MKNDDHEQLRSLLSIFTGYQVGVVLALLLCIFVVLLYFLPQAVVPLIILAAVIVVPYLLITKSGNDRP